MTGEMSQYEADNDEEWAYHREIASYLNGYVVAYDKYLGPTIIAEINGKIRGFFVTELLGKEPNIVLRVVCDGLSDDSQEYSPKIWEYFRRGAADKPSEQHFGLVAQESEQE